MNAETLKRLEAANLKVRTAGIAPPVGVTRADGKAVVASGAQAVRADVLDASGRVVASATAPSESEAAGAAAALALEGGAA